MAAVIVGSAKIPLRLHQTETQRWMAALIQDERCFVLAGFIFFLLMKTEQVISGTSAATYRVTEPH